MKNFKNWNDGLNENKYMDKLKGAFDGVKGKVKNKLSGIGKEDKDPKQEVDKTTDIYKYEKRLVNRIKEVISDNRESVKKEQGKFTFANDLTIGDSSLRVRSSFVEFGDFSHTFRTYELFEELSEYAKMAYDISKNATKNKSENDDLDKLKNFMDFDGK